ncbi:MAG: heme o synthase [Bacteroidota bacterium]
MAVNTSNEKATSISLIRQKVYDYKLLVKLRLSLTVVFSSIMAYLIASNGQATFISIIVLGLGGFLITAAANALNQVLEKDFDKLMTRTANRPLAADRMKISEAVMAAGFMSLIGITLLALFNPWASFLGTLALCSYAFVYTPIKRISPIAVVVGAVPGALPTLIGCVAAQGSLTALGLVLFALQFFWQFPHFWSIGWLARKDYARAGYKIMPTKSNGETDENVGFQAVFYTLFLYPVCLWLWYNGFISAVTLTILIMMTLSYSYFSWNFFRKMDRKAALKLMFFSFFYIPFSLILLYLDTLV